MHEKTFLLQVFSSKQQLICMTVTANISRVKNSIQFPSMNLPHYHA